MTDINIEIRIKNADAHMPRDRVVDNILDELRRLFEDEAVPPVEILVAVRDGNGSDIYQGAIL